MIYSLFEDIIRYISGPLGIRIRRWYYAKRFKSCGRDLVIKTGVFFENPSFVTVGNNVWIDLNCILTAGTTSNTNIKYIRNPEIAGELRIGSNVHLGIRTVIQAHGGVEIGDCFTSGTDSKLYTFSNNVKLSKNGTHHNDKKLLHYSMHPIKIENNVWVGIQSIVMGGVIGNDVFIGDNSFCMGDFEPNSIVKGNPAVKIKNRFS